MSETKSGKSIQDLVLFHRVERLFSNTPRLLVGNFIGGCLWVYFVWDFFSAALLLGWLSFLVFTVIWRAVLVVAYNRSSREPGPWLRHFRISLLFAGLSWAGVGLFMFPANSAIHQSYIVIMLSFMTVLAGTHYTVTPGTSMFFLVPSLAPTIASLAMNGNAASTTLAALLFGSFILSLGIAKQVSTDIVLSIQNAELLKLEAQKAIDASREKDRYVSLIAHDLKSPFATVIQLVDFLVSEMDNLSDRSLDLIEVIRLRCKHSLKAINLVLGAARFREWGKTIELKAFDLEMSAIMVLSEFKYPAENKGIELVNSIPQGMRIFADEGLILEVLKNLVGNAVKFCAQGDKVELRVDGGELPKIIVSDTGQGIRNDFIPNLFRSDIKTTSPGSAGELGTGLGLPICKEIIEAQGGELIVESTPGEGTTFYISLPTQKR